MVTRKSPAAAPTECARAFDQTYRKDFAKLRSIARGLLSRERAGHTLQPTALIHESYFKLVFSKAKIECDSHFFNLCARAMRQVLVDSARSKKWSSLKAVSLPDIFEEMRSCGLAADLELDLKLIHERLNEFDAPAAEVIWLRYFEGRTLQETAAFLGRHASRVRDDCEFGLDWMASQLRKRN